MGIDLKKKYQHFVFSKSGKSQNKVGVAAEEIGCKNDIVLSQKKVF